MDKEQWVYFAMCYEIECPCLTTDGCHVSLDPQDCEKITSIENPQDKQEKREDEK